MNKNIYLLVYFLWKSLKYIDHKKEWIKKEEDNGWSEQWI